MIKDLSEEEIACAGGAMKESGWLYNIGGTLLSAGAGAALTGVGGPVGAIAIAGGLAIIGAGAAAELVGA